MARQPLDGVPDTLIDTHEHLGVTLYDGQGRRYAFISQPHRLRDDKPLFQVRSSGNVGQEILDVDGNVYAWTTDDFKAALICKLLNTYQKVQAKKASSSS